MTFRRLLAAALLGTGLTVIPATSAHAIGVPNTLTVIAYYSDPGRQDLIGQRWSGCGGPGGQWGATSSFVTLFFPAC